MIIDTDKKGKFGFWVRGKVGKKDIEDPFDVYGIYRVSRFGGVMVQEKLKFYRPFNPDSPLQKANRKRMTDAMAEWKLLDESIKNVYKEKAKKLNMFGFNLYVKNYFKNNPLDI